MGAFRFRTSQISSAAILSLMIDPGPFPLEPGERTVSVVRFGNEQSQANGIRGEHLVTIMSNFAAPNPNQPADPMPPGQPEPDVPFEEPPQPIPSTGPPPSAPPQPRAACLRF
jgi:hypothetical protein